MYTTRTSCWPRVLGELDLDFVLHAGDATYELETLELIDGGGELALDPGQVEWVSSHSLERDGARLSVAGVDPWFCIAVPEGPREVSAVRVRGTLR